MPQLNQRQCRIQTRRKPLGKYHSHFPSLRTGGKGLSLSKLENCLNHEFWPMHLNNFKGLVLLLTCPDHQKTGLTRLTARSGWRSCAGYAAGTLWVSAKMKRIRYGCRPRWRGDEIEEEEREVPLQRLNHWTPSNPQRNQLMIVNKTGKFRGVKKPDFFRKNVFTARIIECLCLRKKLHKKN